MATFADHLSNLPRELRDRVLFFVLPDILSVRWHWTPEDSAFRYSSLPLLRVSRRLRNDSLDILRKETVISVDTPETLDALIRRPNLLPGCPRHIRVKVLHSLTLELDKLSGLLPSYWQQCDVQQRSGNMESATDTQSLERHLNPWSDVLSRLPIDTRTLTLDFDCTYARKYIRPPVPGRLVQRVSTVLWSKNKGKTKVRSTGWPLKDAHGVQYIDNCIVHGCRYREGEV